MRRVVLDADTQRSLSRPDTLAVEEPLEIRVDGEPVVVTMRTPGDDLDLAFGFLLAEGLLEDPNAVATGVHCSDTGPDGQPTFNVLELALAPGAKLKDLAGRRTFGMTSACGICGSASIDAVGDRAARDLSDDRMTVRAGVLLGLPDALRDRQSVFDRTGGLHAAGLFTADGELVALREDVGRHNAVDKVLGHAAREIGWPLTGHVLMVSGRASFELAQKAWMAGVPVLAAVSAPSSLAVDLAERAGMTLVGFLRPPSMNVYTGDHRVLLD
ncbi:MAG TPA: formate dehydrogenase accessory sulfurtransferase FdhD, partial [Actinomycetales bacterium]|nr:formate dehydrogenase accessory sulfurtransferase FdhD [Actinomycetales bacterium]